MARTFVILLFLVAFAGTASAACPVGTYGWVDNWGNRICKSFDTSQTRTIQGSTKSCPTGTYRWTDEWDNTICKRFEGNQRFYDTSKGCPVGTYQWVDNWGNKVCKKF